MHRFALAITLALSAAAPALAQTPPPASAFGRLPAVQDADISPDGQHIVMLGGPPAKRTVSIATLDDPQLRVLDLGDAESFSVRWAGNDHAIVRVTHWERVDARHAYHLTRNVVIDHDAKPVSQLLQGAGPQTFTLNQPLIGITDDPKPAAIVIATDWNLAAPNSANTRIAKEKDDADLALVLWRVNLDTGRGSIEERGSSDVGAWDVDRQGHARVRQDFDPTTHAWRLLARPKGAGAWKLLLQSQDEEDSRQYLGYSDPDDAVYLTVVKPDGQTVLTRRRLSDGATEEVTPLSSDDPELIWDGDLQALVGISTGFGLPKRQWLDANIGSVDATLSKGFAGKRVDLESWSSDRSRFLVRVTAPDYAPQWFLFDRTRHELSPVGEEYPELKDVALGKTSTISYNARDGLEIPAFLTLPPGASADAKLPLVVFPHGGPAARDEYDFDWWAQFMASRGYAVLQPQFRGSTGFGFDFEKAGRREWGGKMQTDLLDGIAYLAGQGVVDPTRVCIVGASFGGYAALAGATLHPDAYRCAVSINGVSDLPNVLGETVRAYGHDSGGLRYWKRVMGDPLTTNAMLVATSPARQVTAATAPILLVVSDQDTTVNPDQSARMRTALEAAGKPVKYVTLEDDDHYMTKSATRTKMLEAVGDFLAANLPVGR